MQKSYFSILLMGLLVFSGCNGGGGNANDNNTGLDTLLGSHKTLPQAYRVYQTSIDTEIDKIFPDYTSRFNQDINDSISSSDKNISDATRDLLLKSMLDGFKNDGTRVIRKNIGVGLATKYTELCKDGGIELNVTDAEEQDINKLVKDYFDNTMTQGHVDSLLSPIADKVVHSILGTNQATNNVTLKNAEKVGSFNHLMNGLFNNYDENQTGNNYGGSVNGGTIHGKNRVTNSLEYINNSWKLTINEPLYLSGSIKINTTTKDLGEPFNGYKVKASTPADINGNGYESLIVATCNNNDKSITQFYEVGSRKESYRVSPIFKDDFRINCASISDIVAGDFDGDGRDELAVASKNGVHIFDDAQNGYAFMTKHIEHTGYSTGNTFRLASKNVAGKGYDDLGVVAYNSKPNSTYKARAYLFEMSGMAYKANGVINRDYKLYTLNYQELNDTTPADVVMTDLEGIGRPKMYVIQLRKKQDQHYNQDSESWDEVSDAFSDNLNFWCTFYGNYNNYVDFWSVDNSPSNLDYPSLIKPFSIKKVSEVAIINRISKSFLRTHDTATCQGITYKPEIYLTKHNDLFEDSDTNGYLFSTIEKIDAISYKENSGAPYVISLNGLPFSYDDLKAGGNYEVSKLYQVHHRHQSVNPDYSANSKDSTKPKMDLNDDHVTYEYDDLSLSDYNFINTYIQNPYQGSYYYDHSKTDDPSSHYGNRDESSAQGHGAVYSSHGYLNELTYNEMTYPNDSLVLKYVKHDVLYTDPQVLLYLSTPPVKAGQETTFVYSTGVCNEKSVKDSKSTGITGGYSVSVGVGVEVPEVSNDEFLAGFSTKYDFKKGHDNFSSTSKCTQTSDTITSDYRNGINLQAEDLVKIRSEVIDSYVYEIIDDLNNSANIGKKIRVNDTRTDRGGKTAYYTVWKGVKEYYKIFQDNNQSYIDFHSIVTHTPGVISTYRSQDKYADFVGDYATLIVGDYKYSDFYATQPYQVQQDEYSKVESKTYSISNTHGVSDTEEKSTSYSVSATVKASIGAVVQAEYESTAEIGWTTDNTIEHSSSETNSASYAFSAQGSTTDENTNDVYKYGAYTYFVNKDVNGKMLGQPVQVIDFYIAPNNLNSSIK